LGRDVIQEWGDSQTLIGGGIIAAHFVSALHALLEHRPAVVCVQPFCQRRLSKHPSRIKVYGMSDSPSLEWIPFDELTRLCARENDHFRQRLAHDLRYCFELFRRAIVESNERAWDIFEEQYRPQIARWIQRHSWFYRCDESLEDLVGKVFTKIWLTFASDKNKINNFPNFQRLMEYLKLCVHSEIADALRMNRSGVEELGDVPVEAKQMETSAQEIWDFISTRLKDEKEQLVMRTFLWYGLEPQELYQQFPNRFSGVKEIYRIRQNVIARLRRDSDFKNLFG
jgi:hypothetical protein